MLQVKNKACIRNLSDKSFRQNKTRNLIASLAIALTSVLFTALFLVGNGTLESFQYQTMMQSGGSAMAVIKYADMKILDQLKEHPVVKEVGFRQVISSYVNNPELLKRHAEIYFADVKQLEMMFIQIKEGHMPEKEDEILMDTVSLELLGVPAKLGEKITLDLEVRGESIKREFTLCGYWKPLEKSLNVGFGFVSKAYTIKYADELVNTYNEDHSMEGVVNYDLMFESSAGAEGKLDQIIEDIGYSRDKNSDRYMAGNINWAYVSSSMGTDPTAILAVGSCLLLIMLTGYLIIYNIFQISVLRDIRFYGLLKTIGTTGRQIRKLINLQAIRLCVYGIPAGLLVGYFTGKAMLYLIIQGITYTADIKVEPKLSVFLASILFTIITVFISVLKPGNKAASISPVEAVRFTGISSNNKKLKKTTDGGKIWRIALSNLNRNVKRTALVILSLSLSVILLNSIVTVADSFDIDKYLSRFVDSDFMAGDANYFNYRYETGKTTVSDSLIEAVENQPGFVKGGKTYADLSFVSLKEPPGLFDGEREEFALNTDQEGNPVIMTYGMDDYPLSRLFFIDSVDMEELKSKLDSGKYILSGVGCDDYNNPIDSLDRLKVGDKITIRSGVGTETEVEVAARFKQSYYSNTTRSFISDISIYTTTAGYEKIGGNMNAAMTYSFDQSDETLDSMQVFLQQYTDTVEPDMNFDSKLTYMKNFNDTKNMLYMVGGLLSLVIGGIGILNFINAMITSIITRKKELAVLHSIGMTKSQLRRLVCLEGMYYSAGVIAFSLILGSVFSLAVLGKFQMFWFMTYHFQLTPMLLTFPLLLIIGPIVPYIAIRVTEKDSVVEQLREE